MSPTMFVGRVFLPALGLVVADQHGVEPVQAEHRA